MANITVTVSDEAYREARVHAAREGTSVSALVAGYLESLAATARPRTLGGWEGRVRIADDFDAALPEELQALFDDPAT